jgi:hypothetical protein
MQNHGVPKKRGRQKNEAEDGQQQPLPEHSIEPSGEKPDQDDDESRSRESNAAENEGHGFLLLLLA